jgi:hypothetical protein
MPMLSRLGGCFEIYDPNFETLTNKVKVYVLKTGLSAVGKTLMYMSLLYTYVQYNVYTI